MAKDFIVAVELGSSKITGIAGKKNPDGSINILAVAKEDSRACIRRGTVYNIDKTAQVLTNIVNKLKAPLQADIARVYVGVGGQSLRGVKNTVVKEFAVDTVITQQIVNEVMDTNRSCDYNDYEVLDAITQEYKVGMQEELEPVGVQTRRIEGNFLNLLWRKTFNRSLNKCFDTAGIPIAEMYVTPLLLSDEILTEAEKRAGCLLVDLGAETTTIAVYTRGILRHLSVLPLGSDNITKDLESLHMEEREAETMKLKYASAYTDTVEIDPSMRWAIDKNRSVPSAQFIEVVEARVREIIENVWYQVSTEYGDSLLGGIILTGGGSNMQNIEEAFRRHTKVDKVRTAKFLPINMYPETAKITLGNDGTANGVMSILLRGEMNCAGKEFSQTLFGDENEAEEETKEDTTVKPGSRTAADTKGREKEEEPEDDAEENENGKKPKRRGLFGMIKEQVKGFGKAIIEEE
jgi:cell division protein FtsA